MTQPKVANALEKIIARKIAAAKKPEPAAICQPPAVSTPTDLQPCPTCHSPIRWLNAAGQARCIGCQTPKFAALVRSREILAQLPNSDERRWETLIASPCGRLLSETGIRELAACDELPAAWRGLRPHALTAARVGVGVNGGGVGEKTSEDFSFDRWREVDPDEYFESMRHRQNSTVKKS